MKTKKIKVWIGIEHTDYAFSHTRPKVYLQKIKPKLFADCGCKMQVVRATITYSVPLIKRKKKTT